jgi:hypothetical protein
MFSLLTKFLSTICLFFNPELSGSDPVQNGIAWAATNYALRQHGKGAEFTLEAVEDFECPVFPSFPIDLSFLTNACNYYQLVIIRVLASYVFALDKVCCIPTNSTLHDSLWNPAQLRFFSPFFSIRFFISLLIFQSTQWDR